jgi:RNA polymerase sigma factor (sigma-70 family)
MRTRKERSTDPLLQRYLHDLESSTPLEPEEEIDLALRMRQARERLVGLAGSLPEEGRDAILGRLRTEELTPDLPYDRLEILVNRLVRVAMTRRSGDLDRLAHVALSHWTDLEAARATFVSRNLRLVVHIAKRYAKHGVPLLDLIQEANVGLLRAVDKFDPRHGTRFVTYAPFWIMQAIGREIALLSRVVHVPDYQAKRRQRLARVIGDLKQKHGRMPSDREIAARSRMSLDQIHDSLRLSAEEIDLEDPVDGDDGQTVLETLADGEAGDLLERISNRELLDRLREALHTLNPRQRAILSMHYGLNEKDPRTLQQIGEQMQVTRERVRQVEMEALQALRTVLADGRRPRMARPDGALREAGGPA